MKQRRFNFDHVKKEEDLMDFNNSHIILNTLLR